MPYRVFLAACCLCLPLAACMHNTRSFNPDSRCLRQLTRAQALYAGRSAAADKESVALANGLITAAKIARDAHEYMSCLDKTSRAIELLAPSATSPAQTGQ